MGEGRKTIYWIKSPPFSSTCQWGYSLFSIQPFFHHLDLTIRLSTTFLLQLSLSSYKISHFETFVPSLTVYWNYHRNIITPKVFFVFVHFPVFRRQSSSSCGSGPAV